MSKKPSRPPITVFRYKRHDFHKLDSWIPIPQLWWGRIDIILINEDVPCTCSCGNCHTKINQYCVYPGKEGTIYGDGVEKLSPEDRQWALEESARCWQAALADPLIMKMLYS